MSFLCYVWVWAVAFTLFLSLSPPPFSFCCAAYGVKADCCIFNVTALKEHNWTDRLCHYLEEALLEMRAILDVEEMKSKL